MSFERVKFSTMTMQFTNAEISCVLCDVAAALSSTKYECNSLEILTGGTSNFLYRGVLKEKLGNGEETIVVKHVKGCVASNKDFEMDARRCVYEVAMLKALASVNTSLHDEHTTIRTPRLHYFDAPTNTQILEDLSGTVNLKAVLISPPSHRLSVPASSGRSIGSWLREMHKWGSASDQVTLRKIIVRNQSMRKIRYQISYGAFCDIVQQYDSIWKEYGSILEEVQASREAEYRIIFTAADVEKDGLLDDWGIIHGDFWSGNILLPSVSAQSARSSTFKNENFIIDWELAQLGPHAYDLGQLIGDLYERYHFSSSSAALSVIKDFIAGHGVVTDDMAYRGAIHAGQHFICWHIRGDRAKLFEEDEGLRTECVRIGVEWIVKGWRRDRRWFDASLFRGLFNDRS